MKYKYAIERTYKIGYSNIRSNLYNLLDLGWEIVSCTPMIKSGDTECIEYVLRKEIL